MILIRVGNQETTISEDYNVEWKVPKYYDHDFKCNIEVI